MKAAGLFCDKARQGEASEGKMFFFEKKNQKTSPGCFAQ
jgi:hypothetical protein